MHTLEKLFASKAFQRRIRYYVLHLLETSGSIYDAEHVEDLIQDLNLALWQRIRKYDPSRAQPKPFLNTLVNQQGPEILGKHIRVEQKYSDKELEPYEFCPAFYELPLILGPIVARLPAEMRKHFKYFLEWESEQIVAETGWSPEKLYYERCKLARHPTMRKLRQMLNT